MQMYPERTNMEVFNLIEQSANLFPYYDYAHGYGIPQAEYFFKDSSEHHPNLYFQFANDTILVVIPDEIDLSDSTSDNLLYFHLENEKGVLEEYLIIRF
jgi:hypothetical protein